MRRFNLVEMGVRLRRLREAHGWTIAEAARQIGHHRSNWGRWEKGQRPISVEGLLALCAITDATADYVLFGSFHGMSFDLRSRLLERDDLTKPKAD